MFTLRNVLNATLSLVVVGLIAAAAAAEDKGRSTEQANPTRPEFNDRGRYLVKIAGCNDCHTPGYADAAGQIPERDWLIGDTIGWYGPWGTTYASNLRLYMQDLSEEQWLMVAHTIRFRPPMPWFALRDMTEEDLRAIYWFIRNLGPAGDCR